MPPTAKDMDVTTPNAQSPAGHSTGGKTQPVALEIPVTVNGARTVEGSDKREPFSETTQTVLVFGNGAVIRLSSSVTPGQLLFVTNEKTKREVVCQVLKSKNYSNVSGYVELEFTEAVAGFWGVRFAVEAPARAGAPAVAPVASVGKVQPAAPVMTTVPKQPLPAAPVIAAKTEIVTASAPKVEPKPLAAQPRTPEIPKAPAAPNSWGSDTGSTTSKASEVKAPAPLVASPAAKTPSTPANSQAHLSGEALKRESARLQEQLSAMLFNTEAPSTSSANKQANGDSSSKVIEMTKSQAPPTKTASANSTSGLDSSEVKIPSWLEPLARNAGTPAQNEITTDTPESDEGVEYEVQDLSAPANSEQPPAAPSSEAMPDLAEISEISASESRPAKNNKVILIAAAAAGFLLLAAGTTWYVRQSPSASSQAAITAEAPSSTAAVQPAVKSSAVSPSGSNSGNGGGNFSSAPTPVSASAATSPAINSQPATPTAQPLKAASDKNTAAELSAYRKLAEPPQPVEPSAKKSSFGDVRLAAPSAARRPSVQEAAAIELAPSIGHVAPTGDALGGGLAGSGSKPLVPSAPLPVGGDVKQARLLSSTPPLYPVLAKTQHIEGNVRVDALVDENGKISAMKVISGPTLLHQAAMDAVRQWKYQPATLDGKTVPMHLTVTLQFKLQ